MGRSFPASIETIVQCLADSPDFDLIQSLPDEEWDNIAITAIALGLAPMLHYQLNRPDVAAPPMALAKLALTRQAHARRNGAIAGQLAELLAAFAAENIAPLVLKGALLAPIVYPEPALRPMNDIDLLFRPEALGRVGPVLEGLGYGGKHKDADQGPGITKHLSTYRRNGQAGSTPNPYLSASGDRTVEPHGSLEESWFGLTVDITPGVWQRAQTLTLHGQPAHRLSTPDLLLHLAVHATFHVIMGSSVFLQLYDIKQVVATWRDDIDWSQLLTLAGKAEAEPFLYAGLFWANRLYQAPIPAASLSTLAVECPLELLAYIHSLDAAAILARTQQPPLVSLGKRIRRGLADRRETARWAGSWRAKWHVWQTALAFHKTDTLTLLRQKLRGEP
jgi:hypothetical protein